MTVRMLSGLAMAGCIASLFGCAPAQTTSPAQRPASPAVVAREEVPKAATTQSTDLALTAKNEPAPTPQKSEPFQFADTESGKLLAGFLVPESQPIPPLAIPQSPKPGRPLSLETLGQEPHRSPLEVSPVAKGLQPRGAERGLSVPAETPPLAVQVVPVLPAAVVLPAAPRLYAPSPEAPLPAANAVASTSDPTADAARGALLREPVTGRSTPAAPFSLEIANPFQAVRDAKLRTPPAELPAAAGDANLPRPKFPTTPKAG